MHSSTQVAAKPSTLQTHLPLFLLLLVGLIPVSARAQAKFTGSAASENFGAQGISSTSAVRTLNFSISAETKVGSIAVVTTGVAKLDFANTAASTCKAQTYTAAATCSVAVTFTPVAAGLRKGAVVFYSAANNMGTVLGSAPMYGVGTGAQIAYGPGVVSAIDRTMHNVVGLSDPVGLAVDAAGDLFVLDNDSNPTSYRLVRIPAGGGTATVINTTANGQALYLPSSVAVDGAGNLFVGDFCRRVVEVPAGGSAPTVIEPIVNNIPINYPSGLTVDGAGDLFIADYINNRVVEVPASGGAAIAIDPSVNGVALNDPHGMAVDAAGNLFIADLGNDRIVKLPIAGVAATMITPTANGEGLSNPKDVAVDAAGDLYIADNVNHRVVEVPAGGGAAIALDSNFYAGGTGEMYAVAVDGLGDIFMVQGGLTGGTNIVEEFETSQPPVMNFPTITNVGLTDSTDGPQTIAIMNVGNQPLTLATVSYPADFQAVGVDSNSCGSSMTLYPGQQCEMSVVFSPSNAGVLAEGITLADNAMGTASATQTVALSGTAEGQATMVTPAPGAILLGPTVTFTWTPGTGATGYYLSLGSKGAGSTDVYNSGKRTVTSWTAVGVPTNGEVIYVRLTTYFNNVQMHADYIYTATTQAILTGPAAGTSFPGSTVTFNWTTATGSTVYTLWLGTTGVGSDNLYSSGQTKGTSATLTGLPTNGETIYVRMYTIFYGAQAHFDYTFQAAAQAVLISPAPSTLLPGATTTFTWTAGSSGATGYTLLLGTTGAGSSNLSNSGLLTGLAATVSNLPTNGKTIYARLSTTLNGIQVHTDYIYTAE